MAITSLATAVTLMMMKELVCNSFIVPQVDQNTKNNIETEISQYTHNTNRFDQISIIDNTTPIPAKITAIIAIKTTLATIAKIATRATTQ